MKTKLNINFKFDQAKPSPYCVSGIRRDLRGNITYNSGLMVLENKYQLDEFKRLITSLVPDIDIVHVSGFIKKEPEGRGSSGQYWCPYCGRWETWDKSDGYKWCPICGMSDHDFYVKSMNGLWSKKEEDLIHNVNYGGGKQGRKKK